MLHELIDGPLRRRLGFVRKRPGLRFRPVGELLLQRRKRLRVHREHQVVQVPEDVVDRSKGAADLGGQIACLEPRKAVCRDGATGGGDQGFSQRLAAFGGVHFSTIVKPRSVSS